MDKFHSSVKAVMNAMATRIMQGDDDQEAVTAQALGLIGELVFRADILDYQEVTREESVAFTEALEAQEDSAIDYVNVVMAQAHGSEQLDCGHTVAAHAEIARKRITEKNAALEEALRESKPADDVVVSITKAPSFTEPITPHGYL